MNRTAVRLHWTCLRRWGVPTSWANVVVTTTCTRHEHPVGSWKADSVSPQVLAGCTQIGPELRATAKEAWTMLSRALLLLEMGRPVSGSVVDLADIDTSVLTGGRLGSMELRDSVHAEVLALVRARRKDAELLLNIRTGVDVTGASGELAALLRPVANEALLAEALWERVPGTRLVKVPASLANAVLWKDSGRVGVLHPGDDARVLETVDVLGREMNIPQALELARCL